MRETVSVSKGRGGQYLYVIGLRVYIINNAVFRQQGVLLRTRRKTKRLMGSNELYGTFRLYTRG